jgi:hypothetical protein
MATQVNLETRKLTIIGESEAVYRWLLRHAREDDPSVHVEVMDDPERLFTIDDDADEFTVVELLRDTNDDTELFALLRRLSKGESGTFGGGAAATFKVTRVR